MKELDMENLQLVKRNHTVDVILRIFWNSKQVSESTKITSFRDYLTKSGNQINQDDFYNFFHDMADLDIGYYHQNSDDLFIWNYPLKVISGQILYPKKEVVEMKNEVEQNGEIMPQVKKRGRPPGAKAKNKIEERSDINMSSLREQQRPKYQVPISKQSRDFVFIFTTTDNQVIPLKSEDISNIVTQYEKIKDHLKL